MIIANNVTKQYGSVFALNQVSFQIGPGESVALWGSNGAGKTTTLRCLLGIHSFAGDLKVNQLDVHSQSKAVRAQIGYVPQEAAFYNMTVAETLAFYGALKKASVDEIPRVLEEVQLAQHIEKKVNTLSGGMKQRLALAVALMGDPPILLLDEPTANLDVKAQRDFIHMIQQLNQVGKTIVFSSHRLDEVTTLSQRVLVLHEGQLTLDCHPAELAEKLGLRRWMRIWVPDIHVADMLRVLDEQGYESMPNGRSAYVRVNASGKIAPLRALETAQIPVEDFEMVDSEILPGQEITQ